MAQATGSPASRRSTKLTPLTTRPSFTSRQGMRRALSKALLRATNQRQRLSRIEPPVIKRAACNRAFELGAIRLQQAFDIRQRGKAARRDDRNRDCIGEC